MIEIVSSSAFDGTINVDDVVNAWYKANHASNIEDDSLGE